MIAIEPAETALFLDLDGTLIDFARAPQDAAAPPSLIADLAAVSRRLDGALAIITGRAIADADRLLAPLRLVTAGVHGAEVRAVANSSIIPIMAEVPPRLLADVRRAAGANPGVLVEPKGAGVAVHFRLAPLEADRIESELHALMRASDHALTLCRGRMVFDILPSACSKRTGMERLLRLAPFCGRTPVMIGDDRPDEPALELATLRGGRGLRVAGEHFPAAIADFPGPAAVRLWLARLAGRVD